MLTDNIRNQIECIWDTLFSGRTSRKFDVIEQFGYL